MFAMRFSKFTLPKLSTRSTVPSESSFTTGRYKLSDFLSCGNQQYVMKRVSSSIFELSQVLKHEFGTDPCLRTHIDDNQDESILVYEYFKDNLLSLVHKNPDLSIKTRKNILREVAMALGKLHSRQWIHLGKFGRKWVHMLHTVGMTAICRPKTQ